MQKSHIPHQRSLNIFVLAMIGLSLVVSLRNLPLTAEYGLASVFYYVIAAIVFMAPYALIAAELASGWPKEGGIYIWVRTAMGDRWGFFTIWMQWFRNITWYPALLSFVAAAIAQLFNPALASNKLYIFSVVVIGFWGVTFLNFLGIKTSAYISASCVILGVVVPGFILIVLAGHWVFSGNPLSITLSFKELIPDFSKLSNFVFFGGVFLALAGLEASANLAREVKHPQKNYPKAILIAAILTLVILILGSLAIAIVIPKKEISLVSGLLDAFRSFFVIYNLQWLIPIVAFLTIFGGLGELNAWAITPIKGLFVTTETGSLPPVFHKLNRHHTPVNLLLFQAILVTIAAFLFLIHSNVSVTYWVLNALTAQMYILTYLVMFVAAIILRYKKPHVKRAYRIPFGNVGMWVAVIVGSISSIFVIAISFMPPTGFFKIANPIAYGTIMALSFIISCLLPFIVYAFRKPHWKLEAISQMREDIHNSMY